jgi:hypothetical protein
VRRDNELRPVEEHNADLTDNRKQKDDQCSHQDDGWSTGVSVQQRQPYQKGGSPEGGRREGDGPHLTSAYIVPEGQEANVCMYQSASSGFLQSWMAFQVMKAGPTMKEASR